MTPERTTSSRTLLGVTAALLALLAITAWLSTLDLGAASLPLALTIAAAKTALVLSWFMALRLPPAVFRMVVAVGLILLVLLLLGTLADTTARSGPDTRAATGALPSRVSSEVSR